MIGGERGREDILEIGNGIFKIMMGNKEIGSDDLWRILRDDKGSSVDVNIWERLLVLMEIGKMFTLVIRGKSKGDSKENGKNDEVEN